MRQLRELHSLELELPLEVVTLGSQLGRLISESFYLA